MKIIIKERKIEKYTELPKTPFGIKINKIGGDDNSYAIITEGKDEEYFFFTTHTMIPHIFPIEKINILQNLNGNSYEIVDFEIIFYKDMK